jgi:hypothetical protein
MRLREAVASALHLLVIGLFFVLAAILFWLPSNPDWRFIGVNWLMEKSEPFYWMGAIFMAMGFFFMLGFYGIGRGRFLRLLMKPHIAIVDTKLLREVVEDCFRTHFPRLVRGVDIAVASNQCLDVAIDLMALDNNRQMKLLREMEKQLSYLLRQRFGYCRPFILSVRLI